MPTLKNLIFFLITSIICISCHSCRNGEKIAELGNKIVGIQQQINSDSDKITRNDEAIDLLEKQKSAQYKLIDSYDFARDSLVNESPFAAAYIHEFYQRDTIAILEEYIRVESNDEFKALLLKHTVLLIYYSSVQAKESVRVLLANLLQLDSSKRICLGSISGAESKEQPLKTANARLADDIKGLEATKNEYVTTQRDLSN